MICQGPTCGKPFEAKRRTAKWCSGKCSMAASRAGELGVPTPADAPDVPGVPGAVKGSTRGRKRPSVAVKSRLYATTLAELSKAGRVETHGGQAALVLAQRIDQGGAETGSALAAMIREHAAAVDRALAGDNAQDPITPIENAAADKRRLHSVANPK